MTSAHVPTSSGPPGWRQAGVLPRWMRVPALVTGIVLVLCSLLALDPPRAYAATYTRISGVGSTWSANAIQQWVTNVSHQMTVNYADAGSSQGRQEFRNGTADFGVSEIPYGLRDGGVLDVPPSRGYAYMPIVAGGTSFMYNLKIGGQRVRNLRLSGDVITKIFTGKITRWNDAAIKADNPSLNLPPIKIVPVYRSDGSGTTAQFSLWMSKQYPSLWNDYCRRAGRSANPCGMTSNYPFVNGSGFIGKSQSLGVQGFVKQEHNQGSITYVEYSYAKSINFPVVKVLNKASYYVAPTAEAVAVGLLKAQINNNKNSKDYLTQILDGVYNDRDPRTYPLSSYSYMILPTKAEAGFTTAKGRTLSAFSYYFLCEGQQQAAPLGYSPLPMNLVKAGLEQVKRIPGTERQTVDLKGCNNPTFSSDGKTNTLAKNAPQPPACDRKGGPTQCTSTGKPAPKGNGGSASGGSGGASSGGSNGSGGASGGSGGSGGATGGADGGADGGAAEGATGGAGTEGAVIDPDTGEILDPGSDAGGGEQVYGTNVAIGAESTWGLRMALMLLSGAMLIGVVVAPPLASRYLNSRGRRRANAA
ncbi:phosphate ABC transporter substrate-binding protein PstS [Streptomyces formicae]|nr:phosphate ABC transporter substrate-binding protein PstS [Streptomyces formicae]